MFPAPTRALPGGTVSLLCCLLLAGCSGSDETAQSKPDQQKQRTVARTSRDACRSRLEGALRRLPPDSVAAITNVSRNAGALNAWLVECAAEDAAELQPSEANLAFLDAGARRAVTSPRFTARDTTWVRNAIISARLTEAISSRARTDGIESEAAQIVRLFYWVGDNISLLKEDEPGEVRGYLEYLFTGRGPLEARVWIFAVLCRQMQRAAVLLFPEGERDLSQAKIGVAIDDRILLFDPSAWMPIADAQDRSAVPLDTVGLEALEPDDIDPGWSAFEVGIVAETSAVCPRMLVLQQQLPAASSAILYEELAGGTSEIRPLVTRVCAAAAGRFESSQFFWWAWPDQTIAARTTADETGRRIYGDMMRPFEAPFEREPIELETDYKELLSRPDINKEQRDALWAQRFEMEYRKMQEMQKSGDINRLFGRPSGRLLQTRLRQIEGNHDQKLIQHFQRIRTACIDDAIRISVPPYIDQSGERSIPIPDAIQNVNRSATGAAMYWAGICHVDRGKPGIAITSLRSYRRQYPDGVWVYPSMINEAKSLLRQERTEDAVTLLEQADVDANPERAHVAALLGRLQYADGEPPEPAPTDDAPPNSDPDPPTADSDGIREESATVSEPDDASASQDDAK